MEIEQKHQADNKLQRTILITYLIYVILYESLIILGTAYVVFGLHYSGWWWALAVAFSSGCYKPSEWNRLLSGKKHED